MPKAELVKCFKASLRTLLAIVIEILWVKCFNAGYSYTIVLPARVFVKEAAPERSTLGSAPYPT